MKIIGLTGGIGSGKTTISKVFIDNSIKVYNSDDRAKFLMINSSLIY
jgi:dephospho-CoA kinase